MSELPTYRDHIEQLNTAFGGRQILTISDTARYVGHSRKWTREVLGVNHDITVAGLAHKLAQIDAGK